MSGDENGPVMAVTALSCCDRSRAKVRKVATENGWTITKDRIAEWRYGSALATIEVEKDVRAGRVRQTIRWEGHRYRYSTAALVGSARMYHLRNMGSFLQGLTDPEAGWYPTPKPARGEVER